MKKNILLACITCFLLTVATFGQSDDIEAVHDRWIKLGRTFGSQPGNVFYRDLRLSADGSTVEAWMKIVPLKPVVLPKKRTTYTRGLVPWAYVLQYLTVDCDQKRYTTEKSLMYNKHDNVINDGYTTLWTAMGLAADKTPIPPGSMAEIAWRRFCRER